MRSDITSGFELLDLFQGLRVGKMRIAAPEDSRVLEWYANASENVTSYCTGEDAANCRYAAATDFERISTLNPFPCLIQDLADVVGSSIATATRILRGYESERTKRVGRLRFRRIAAEQLR